MLCLLCALMVCADPIASEMTWKIDGVTREATVFAPSVSRKEGEKVPVVFAFHGHGGTSSYMARSMGFQKLWPEALVIYMQGLPTPGALTDPDGKRPGWQKRKGDQDDRDLKFFDAALATIKEKYPVDDSRIYAMGHSNGGSFTYILWATRGDIFAAFAPTAAPALGNLRAMKPKPALHIAGEQDKIVPFAMQKRTIDAIKKLNGCDADGEVWESSCKLYKSKGGTPFVEYVHPGGHMNPRDAAVIIVKFFKDKRKAS